MCIKFVLEKRLYYDAWSEKHQISCKVIKEK